MPFNKGDFTQQGVAGHVNANIRLNEKRLVNIDLTSNEEAEGCTISGAVADLLNDKVYPIGAGVSGNIEITENGENINVAPYATATVNVSGGGEIPFFELTVVNNSDSICYPRVAFTQWLPEYNGYRWYGPDIDASDSLVIENLLYSVNTEPEKCFIPAVFDHESISELTYSASNLVNCTFNDTEFIITDPSLSASATLTISSGGVG